MYYTVVQMFSLKPSWKSWNFQVKQNKIQKDFKPVSLGAEGI